MVSSKRFRSRGPIGLTLVEVLVVVIIISMLVGLSLGVMARSRRDARIGTCKHNMQQFYVGIQMFDDDHDRFRENYPARLTFLHYFKGTRSREYLTNAAEEFSGEVYIGPKYLADARQFICPLDATRGREGGKPKKVKNQYTETDEGPGRGAPALPNESPWSSYLYEFSEALCDWWEDWVESPDGFPPYGPYYDPDFDEWDTDAMEGDEEDEIIDTNWDMRVTWQETKFYQQKFGDRWLHDSFGWYGGYPRSWFPVVRCFWHQRDSDVEAFQKDILNLSMSGNLFTSGPIWEVVATQNLDADADMDGAKEDFWDEEDWDD